MFDQFEHLDDPFLFVSARLRSCLGHILSSCGVPSVLRRSCHAARRSSLDPPFVVASDLLRFGLSNGQYLLTQSRALPWQNANNRCAIQRHNKPSNRLMEEDMRVRHKLVVFAPTEHVYSHRTSAMAHNVFSCSEMYSAICHCPSHDCSCVLLFFAASQ